MHKFLRRLKDRPRSINFQICIRKDVRLDQLVYNVPTTEQVAAIWIEGNNPNAQLELNIVVPAHSGHRHTVKHYYSCYDPLQYPLLFPKGELGWHPNIEKQNFDNNDANVVLENGSNIPNFTSTEDIFVREQQGK